MKAVETAGSLVRYKPSLKLDVYSCCQLSANINNNRHVRSQSVCNTTQSSWGLVCNNQHLNCVMACLQS